jgi:hypothetical protein
MSPTVPIATVLLDKLPKQLYAKQVELWAVKFLVAVVPDVLIPKRCVKCNTAELRVCPWTKL